MINFDNIKFALFDFDDTLCIHTRHGSAHNDLERDSAILQGDLSVWRTCFPNTQISLFMQQLKKAGVPLGLISATRSCKHAELKKLWVKENYGVVLQNFSVGKRKDKVEVLKALAEAEGLKPEEILFADDCYKTVDEAANLGFQACTPMEIINFVNVKRLTWLPHPAEFPDYS